MTSTATPSATRTARTILVAWANEQGHWVRTIVGDVLAARRALSPERVGEVCEQFLVEKNLRTGTPIEVPPLPSESVAAEAIEPLTLLKLDAVENVNALTGGQALDFNAGLTIVFGKNGSGKSGYVRILKRLARVRAVEAVLPNVVAAKGTKGPPGARLSYQLGAARHSMDWKGEEGVHPLTRLDVFDTRSIALHVDEDLTFVYTPHDLALFGHVNEAVEGVRTRFEADVKASASGANPFLAKFARDTRLFPKIELLGAATDLAELEQLGVVTAQETEGLDGLRERVSALRPESSNARVLQADADRIFLEQALAVCGILRRFDHAQYRKTSEELAKAEQKYRLATENAFSETDIPGVLGVAWGAFVVAGDVYRTSVGLDRDPSANEKCLYCRQDLAAAALDLLQKYRDYCNNQLKRDVDAARSTRAAFTRELTALELGPLSVEVLRRERLAQDEKPALLTDISTIVKAAGLVHTDAREGRAIDPASYNQLVKDAETSLGARLEETKKLIAVLRGQVDQRAKAYTEESARLKDIEARLVLRVLLGDIRKYVETARWVSKAQTLSSRFKPLLKSLTEAVKEASEGLLNQDFERLFRAECEVLRAPAVRLDFPGRNRQPARRKVLATNYKLSDILSEGEQKVIALADFLAEAQLKTSPNPIIFDDPVNSLDYERMREVVARIVKLSSLRQVVIFTHNIWFAIEMVNNFDDRKEPKDRCSYFDIAYDDGRCGLLSGGTNPRADSMTSIAGRLNKTIQEARAATGEAKAALIEAGYGHVRSWCEVVVEVELLKGAVQRYQPNVRMTVLDQIKGGALAPAIGAIVPAFEKASRYIGGHSQPLETLNVRPELSELEKDWAALQQALTTYRAA